MNLAYSALTGKLPRIAEQINIQYCFYVRFSNPRSESHIPCTICRLENVHWRESRGRDWSGYDERAWFASAHTWYNYTHARNIQNTGLEWPIINIIHLQTVYRSLLYASSALATAIGNFGSEFSMSACYYMRNNSGLFAYSVWLASVLLSLI